MAAGVAVVAGLLPVGYRSLVSPSTVAGPDEQATAAKVRAQDALGRLPLSFEANKGQVESNVDFLTRGAGFGMSFSPTETVLTLKSAAAGEVAPRSAPEARWTTLKMQVVGGNAEAQPVRHGALPGKVNSFIGDDPTKWVTDIATYRKVGYQGVYPGIDLLYYGRQGVLEYDFVVAPGADPGAIALNFDGAESVAIDAGGNLVLKTAAGDLRQLKPVLYQEVGGRRRPVEGAFALKGGNQVGFTVGAYDATRRLVIDPVLAYSTYLGGRNTDFGFGIVVDPAGNIYLGGQSTSAGTNPQFPGRTAVGGSTLSPSGIDDAYVAKLAPNGSGGYTLVYAAFVGGPLSEAGWDVGVDSSGNAYLAGSTNSADDPGTVSVTEPGFPTTGNALDGTCGSDGYCNRLPAGWFDEDDPDTTEVIEAGPCPLSVFPNGCATPPSSLGDNFLVKLNAAGNALLYSTYLGGADAEVAGETIPYAAPMGVAVSGSKAFIHSWTGSVDFPTTASAYQPTCASCDVGNPDGYLTVIDTSKSGNLSLAYSTYVGGSGIEDGKDIALDKAGMAYVVGTTIADYSLEDPNSFPTKNALQGTYRGGNSDGYLAKFNTGASGASSLVYSTFLGGGGTDEAWDVAAEDGTAKIGGKAYVTGYTTSGANPNTDVPGDEAPDPAPYFPTTKGAWDRTFNGRATTASGSSLFLDGDAFVTKFKADGKTLAYSTFVGGPNADYGNGIAVDSKGQAYVAGWTTCRMQDNRAVAGNQAPPQFSTFDDDGDPNTPPIQVATGRNPGEPADTGVGDCDAANQAGAFPQINPIPGEETMDTTFLGIELHNSPTALFVTKLLPTGVGAAYSVLLDGPGFDRGFAIAVRDKNAQGQLLGYTDPNTNTFVPQPEAYATGRAQVDYPLTANALQPDYNRYQTAPTTSKPTPGNGRDAPLSKIVG